MKVLVIGGTRFLGTYLVEELLTRGHEVTIYHRGVHETTFLYPVEHIHGDRTDTDSFKKQMAKISVEAVIDMMPMNGQESRAVVEAFRGRIERSVHISSADVYDWENDTGLPIPVPEEAPLRSSEPVEITIYGQKRLYNKVASEEALREAQDFPATILRLSALFGPHASLAREWFFVKRIRDGRRVILLPGDGSNIFHQGYVKNVAHAIRLALEKAGNDGQAYNVGDKQALTVRQMAEMMARLLNHSWDIVTLPRERIPAQLSCPYAPPFPILLDLTKIKSRLGYRDPISLEESWERTVTWLFELPEEEAPTLLEGYYQYYGASFDYDLEDKIWEKESR